MAVSTQKTLKKSTLNECISIGLYYNIYFLQMSFYMFSQHFS